MKRLADHTPEELLALTEDQVYTLIDVECANVGAPIAGVVPTPPEPCEGKPNVTAYKVVVGDLFFSDMREADDVVEYLMEKRRLKTSSFNGEYSWQGPCHLVQQEDAITVEQERHWTQEHHDKHKRDLERYKQQKEDYDSNMGDYNSAITKRSTIEDGVWRRVREAQTTANDQAKLRAQFTEYCKIADEDKKLALQFLLKATPYDESFVRTTLNMEIPMEDNYVEEEK